MLTKDLEIYKDTYRLVSLLTDYVGVFDKKYRYSLGEKIMKVSLELFEYIQLANREAIDRTKRSKYLEGFLIKFELLKTLLRLCEEKHVITIKQTARLAVLTESIGKQATAWKNR